jgi:type IV secretory pathway TraG/TraD family ATPase VirD4
VTRALGPRPGGIPPGSGGAYAVLGICGAAAGVGMIVWLGGHLASMFSGHGWAGPAPSWEAGIRLIKHGPQLYWPEVPANLVWMLSGAIAAVVLFLVVAIYAKVDAGREIPGDPLGSLAKDSDVAQLTPKGAARRAVELRPSLKGVEFKKLPPAEIGLLLGRLRPAGPELRCSWEDVVLTVMAPRAGKTSGLAVNQVLDAPGPVIATSNKSDLLCLTAELRAEATHEPVWVFDPQSIAHSKQSIYWNPLRGVDHVEPAQRLASQFVIGMKGERRAGGDFWLAAAEDVLVSLLLAAGSTRGDLTLADVFRWLNRPTDPLPVRLLEEYGHTSRAESLAGYQAGAMETREGIFQTARTAARCLGDPTIVSWVTPPRRPSELRELSTEQLAASRQTLYLLAKENAGGAGPLVAALCDRILQDAIRLAESRGGRLDPPLVAVLDEMCNLPVADLPNLYSHLGSRSIVPVGIAQSWSQIVGVWGETAARALWGASTVKIIGAGIDDGRFLQELSELVGDHDVNTRTLQYGNRSFGETVQVRKQRILPPERIRELGKGTALVFASGSKPALVDLQLWFKGARSEEISSANARAVEALTGRAGAVQTKGGSGLTPASRRLGPTRVTVR